MEMNPHDLDQIRKTKPNFESVEPRQAKFWNMAEFGGGTTWIGEWVGESPWERHSGGDEFLHVLKGQVEVDVISATGKTTVTVSEGSIFVVPKNCWHRQRAKKSVTVLGATPGVTDHSDSEPTHDPA